MNEYTWDESKKEYVMSRMSVELGRYIADQGYQAIKVHSKPSYCVLASPCVHERMRS